MEARYRRRIQEKDAGEGYRRRIQEKDTGEGYRRRIHIVANVHVDAVLL